MLSKKLLITINSILSCHKTCSNKRFRWINSSCSIKGLRYCHWLRIKRFNVLKKLSYPKYPNFMRSNRYWRLIWKPISSWEKLLKKIRTLLSFMEGHNKNLPTILTSYSRRMTKKLALFKWYPWRKSLHRL